MESNSLYYETISSVYNTINGRVITISPDAIYSESINEKPYYEIRVETENNYFVGNDEKYYMYPGTQVLALINIGERTISEYLLEPIVAKLDLALTEK